MRAAISQWLYESQRETTRASAFPQARNARGGDVTQHSLTHACMSARARALEIDEGVRGQSVTQDVRVVARNRGKNAAFRAARDDPEP